jgi:hypothetical protein
MPLVRLSENQSIERGEDLVATLRPMAADLEQVGLEAGPLSQHLFGVGGSRSAGGLRRGAMAQVLRAQTMNKTDRNDARGLAQMMRVGLFKPVHIKSDRSQRLNVLKRESAQVKLLDIEADLRGLLNNFGLKVGKVTPKAFEARAANWPSMPSSPRWSSPCWQPAVPCGTNMTNCTRSCCAS